MNASDLVNYKVLSLDVVNVPIAILGKNNKIIYANKKTLSLFRVDESMLPVYFGKLIGCSYHLDKSTNKENKYCALCSVINLIKLTGKEPNAVCSDEFVQEMQIEGEKKIARFLLEVQSLGNGYSLITFQFRNIS